MEENTKQKCKRRRANPSHRWTELETLHLIQAVADETKEQPESFEKPTAERFYTRIKSRTLTLEKIEWMSLKCKMRYLKSSYVSAVDWKNRTGSGLLASGDEKSVAEYINKTCPHFDLLAAIFGQRKNVSPPFIYDSHTDVEFLSDHCDSISYDVVIESGQDSVIEPPSRSQTSTPEPLTPINSFDITQRKRKQKKICNSNPFNNLQIQEKKLELEVQKLELEKEKEKNQVELKALELKNQFELRKLELEMQKDEKLQIEKTKIGK